MKLRPVKVSVSEHAILRFLERYHGVDIKAVRKRLLDLATTGATHGALSVKIEGVRLVLREQPQVDGIATVTVTTVLPARSGSYVD